MAQAESGGSPQLRRLQFRETLSWRAGKAIPVGELLKRMNSLSKEMNDMEQEEVDRESLRRAANDLVSPNLMAHKDQGVRAWAACCLVDILRLYAPDAPYTGPQLKVRPHVTVVDRNSRRVGSLQALHVFDITSTRRSLARLQPATSFRPQLPRPD